MECVYRLLYSSLAVQWKSYLMVTDSYLFPFLLTGEQECLWMTIFLAFTSLGSRINYSAGSVVRYWYVKTSLKPEVSVCIRSRKILYVCLGVPHFLLLLHLVDGLRVYYSTKERFPVLLYQACIDPSSEFSIPFYKSMPLQLTMMYIYVFIAIYNNIYLYWFLRYLNYCMILQRNQVSA